jgi:hypothetical protein
MSRDRWAFRLEVKDQKPLPEEKWLGQTVPPCEHCGYTRIVRRIGGVMGCVRCGNPTVTQGSHR